MTRAVHPMPPALGRLLRDRRGNVAMIFSLAMLLVMVAVGAAVDYARVVGARTQLQNGADMLALTIARELQDGKTETEVRGNLSSMLAAELKQAGFTQSLLDFTFDPSASTVAVVAGGSIPSTFLEVVGVRQLPMKVNSVATVGAEHVEIALVLDNTGSMNQSGKLDQLKLAADGMIDLIAASEGGRNGLIALSVVPFGVNVNVGAGHDGANWLDAPQTTTQCTSYPYFHCWTQNVGWSGCVADRPSPYTTTATIPFSGNAATLFPHEYARACSLASLMPLSTDFAAVRSKIDGMVAGGTTNLPIGLAWGWNMLTPGAPLSAASPSTAARKVFKYLILLTDGNNTENTLGDTVGGIDALTATACANVKTAGVTVFTIRVIDGNQTLLQSCASSAGNYYEANDPVRLTDIFRDVFRQITRLRLTS